MYAGSIIKIKMRKSHAFYCVQLTVLWHARRSYLLVAAELAVQVARPTCADEYVQVRRKHHKVEWP